MHRTRTSFCCTILHAMRPGSIRMHTMDPVPFSRSCPRFPASKLPQQSACIQGSGMPPCVSAIQPTSPPSYTLYANNPHVTVPRLLTNRRQHCSSLAARQPNSSTRTSCELLQMQLHQHNVHSSWWAESSRSETFEGTHVKRCINPRS